MFLYSDSMSIKMYSLFSQKSGYKCELSGLGYIPRILDIYITGILNIFLEYWIYIYYRNIKYIPRILDIYILPEY